MSEKQIKFLERIKNETHLGLVNLLESSAINLGGVYANNATRLEAEVEWKIDVLKDEILKRIGQA